MKQKMRRYEIWIGVEHGQNDIIEIVGREIGKYEDKDENGDRGIVYRAYRKADGSVLIHRYDWSNIGGGDRASAFEYDSLEAAACEFRNVLEKMNLI